MRTLSIFVDESGDFGEYEEHCPHYIFSLVFHDQSNPIVSAADSLEDRLFYAGMPRKHCFHAMPLIRMEDDYHHMSLPERRKMFGYFLSFFRAIPVKYTSFVYDKRESDTVVDITMNLSRQLSQFITHNWDLFTPFDRIIVYYDNGQIELTRILVSVFASLLPNVEFRKVLPVEYRLFQIADLCCAIDLIRIKLEQGTLSKSEALFFGNRKDMKKNYFSLMDKKLIK